MVDGAPLVIDEFVLAGPGPYFFFLPTGDYRVAAFQDVDRNSTDDPGTDPAALLTGGEPVTAAAGATVGGLDIEIAMPGRRCRFNRYRLTARARASEASGTFAPAR